MGASSSSSFVAEGRSSRPVPKYEYDMILQQEMGRRYNIRHLDLSRWSPRRVRGHGHAKCNACFRKWTSYQASAIIDLNKQTIIKVWKQKCQACDNIIEMTFTKDEFRRAVNIMLDKLEQQINGVGLNMSKFDDTSFGGPPHIKELCEGCDWGSGHCRAAGGGGGGGGSQFQRFGTGNKGSGAFRGSKSSSMSDEPRSASTRQDNTGLSEGQKIAIGCAAAVGGSIGGFTVALIGGLAAWAFSLALKEEDKKEKKK